MVNRSGGPARRAPAADVLGDAAGSATGKRAARDELDAARSATHRSNQVANDPGMTLTEVRAILRHADINTTGIYTAVRVEDLFDKLQEHYARPQPPRRLASGYDPDDVKIVFGG